MPRQVSSRDRYDEKFNLSLQSKYKEKVFEFAEGKQFDVADVFRDGADIIMNGRLPVLGRIPCGPLEEAVEATPYFVVVPPCLRPRADLGDFLYEAAGDSMSPRIASNDLVLLRPGIEHSEGEICAVNVFRDKGYEGDAEGTLKRVFYEPGRERVILRSINPEYKDMVVNADFVKVVAVFRGAISMDGGRSY